MGGASVAAPQAQSDLRSHAFHLEAGSGIVFDINDRFQVFGHIFVGRRWVYEVSGQDLLLRVYSPIPGDERYEQLRIGLSATL